jgi:hypothetical protein
MNTNEQNQTPGDNVIQVFCHSFTPAILSGAEAQAAA